MTESGAIDIIFIGVITFLLFSSMGLQIISGGVNCGLIPNGEPSGSGNATIITQNFQTTHFPGNQLNVFIQNFTGLTVGKSVQSVAINVFGGSGNVRVKVYASNSTGNDTAGFLIGESKSLPVTGTGIQTFRLNSLAPVPASGIVWAGFETDNAALDLFASLTNVTGFQGDYNLHTYGSGPNPFNHNPSNFNGAFPYWEQIVLVTSNSSGTTVFQTACETFVNNSSILFIIASILILLLVLPLIRTILHRN